MKKVIIIVSVLFGVGVAISLFVICATLLAARHTPVAASTAATTTTTTTTSGTISTPAVASPHPEPPKEPTAPKLATKPAKRLGPAGPSLADEVADELAKLPTEEEIASAKDLISELKKEIRDEETCLSIAKANAQMDSSVPRRNAIRRGEIAAKAERVKELKEKLAKAIARQKN